MLLINISDLIKDNTTQDFSKPQIVGNYSVDGERHYFNDISQLKYYKQLPNPENVKFDLDYNSSKTIHKPEDVDCKLDSLLRWISDNFHQLKTQDSEKLNDRWLEPEIVCYRGLLTNLLRTPYDKQDGWIICASKYKGTIYLCAFDSDKVKQDKLRRSNYVKKCLAWGFKFEQYVLSDTPSAKPNLTIPLNENEEFCCMFKSKLGKTNLLYGAEIDGICSQQQIQDTLVGKSVELIELKTMPYRAINHKGLISSSRASMTLKWWCQSYLADIERIICGCKNNNAIVIKVKEFKCSQLLKHTGNLFSETVCKNFCNEFLERIKTIVDEDYNKYIYKFTYSPGNTHITVDKLEYDPQSEYAFLHSWYIEKAEQHFQE